MPQHKSPIKRMKTDKKREARNNYVIKTIRTLSKKLRDEASDDEKRIMLNSIYSQLDKAAKKGIIHKRTASRRKSRLAQLIKNNK